MNKTILIRRVNRSSRPQQKRVINCLECGVLVSSFRTNQKYCTPSCFKKYQRKRSYTAAETEYNHLTTSSKGAAAELLVCADLVRRGLSAFRAVSPASAYDLIASTPDGRVWRLQVKKGRRMSINRDGKPRVMYQMGRYKLPAGTDVIAFAILKDPMEVFYFRAEQTAVFFPDKQWKFWEVN